MKVELVIHRVGFFAGTIGAIRAFGHQSEHTLVHVDSPYTRHLQHSSQWASSSKTSL